MTVETEADRAAFFDADEFAEPVTWTHGATATPVIGILSAPVSLFDTGAEVSLAIASADFICPASMLPAGAAEGDLIAARVSAWWTVRALLPDGQGMVRALLQLAPSDGIGMLDFSIHTNSQYISLI